MMMSATDLDEAEFLHLALRAMEADRHEEAISLLKRMAGAFPANANAHYLLGAEHAQIGLYDRALADFAAALRVQPRLAAARFQLGLLHLTLGQAAEAQSVLAPLDELASDDPLRLFKAALVHLMHDELEECARGLRAGIDRNRGNEALNADMRRLLADVERRFAGGSIDSDGSAATPPALLPVHSSRMILETYDQNGDGGADD